MTATLFICTLERHLPFFRLCARSINRHVRGFSDVVVVVPERSSATFLAEHFGTTADGVPIRVIWRWEPEDRTIGHRHMNASKMMADIYSPQAELICHIDADSVFTRDVTPADYTGSFGPIPILAIPYAQAGDARVWEPLTARSLGWPPAWEGMQRPELSYWRDTYQKARSHIEREHGMPFLEFALTYHVPEFPTLSAFALERQPESYLRVGRAADGSHSLPRFVKQGWSHFCDDLAQLPARLAEMEQAIG